MRAVVPALLGLAFALAATAAAAEEPVAEWPVYGGDAGGSRYSPLAQIDKGNIARLAVAWEYHTGDVSDGSGGRRKSALRDDADRRRRHDVSDDAIQPRRRARPGDRP